MNYIMYAHAGSGNHGCEAIVRSSQKMLDNKKGILFSKNISEDIEYQLDKIIELRAQPCRDGKSLSKNSVIGLKNRLKAKLFHEDYDLLESVYWNRDLILPNTVALSIGGDNYCYRGIINELRECLNVLKYKKIPTVLWGCSVSPDFMDDSVLNDLRKYDLITVRETLSEQLLRDHNANSNIVLCADPAFTLEMQETAWSKPDMNNSEIIGINISGFMGYYESFPNATIENIKVLIQHILETTDFNIALIPHVVHKDGNNNDLVISKSIASVISSKRVFVIDEDYNCMQLKSLISKCRMFVGCRTHATIAAYSTCVPTLTIGYSTKSIGIAKDLFGSDEGLVVPVQNLTDKNCIKQIFQLFSEREKQLKKRLVEFIPEYKFRAYNSKIALERLYD